MTPRRVTGFTWSIGRGSERGTTLVEVTLAVALVVVVMGAVLGTFDVFTRAEHRQGESLQTRRDVRQALGEVTRDLRTASRIVAPASSASAGSDLTITRPTGATTEAVRFRWDATTRQLRRDRSARPGSRTTASRLVLARAASNPGSTPTFRYFDATGVELVAGVAPAARIAACTTRVEITLTGSTPSGRTGGTVGVAVSPRNFRAEEVSC